MSIKEKKHDCCYLPSSGMPSWSGKVQNWHPSHMAINLQEMQLVIWIIHFEICGLTSVILFIAVGSPLLQDIVLIKLDRPAVLSDYVNPVCLSVLPNRFPPGSVCVTAGWGQNTEGTSNWSKWPSGALQMYRCLFSLLLTVPLDTVLTFCEQMICQMLSYLTRCRG